MELTSLPGLTSTSSWTSGTAIAEAAAGLVRGHGSQMAVSYSPRVTENPLPAAAELPSAVSDLLWDVAPGEVRLPRHRDFLIGRILARGTWAAVQWLRRELGDAEIAEYVQRTRGRLLSPRQLRFWELVLGLDENAVSGWIAERRDGSKLWDRRETRSGA